MSKNNQDWVDFKEIKQKVSMEMVLRHYGVFEDLRKSGENLVGRCPIHKGSNSRQFSVNLEGNKFNCFGNCKSGGNVLDFVSKMEKVSIRDAALMLQNWFLDGSAQERGSPLQKEPELVREKKEEFPSDEPVNPPLNFVLKSLTPKHPFFKERGIESVTVEHFGLGFCSRGFLKGRIAIPIHDENGQLVAYCGRAVSNEQIEEEGKYKLPPKFFKSAIVYNLHRQKNPDSLILVESFLSVWRLYQAGFENAVALMGSNLGDRHENLIVKALAPEGRAVLIFDNDDSGRLCTDDCLRRLAKYVFVKVVDISGEGEKPHQLTDRALHLLLNPGG